MMATSCMGIGHHLPPRADKYPSHLLLNPKFGNAISKPPLGGAQAGMLTLNTRMYDYFVPMRQFPHFKQSTYLHSVS
eukprot:scaffold216_cov375-Pavlova_lutheri.AAC.8